MRKITVAVVAALGVSIAAPAMADGGGRYVEDTYRYISNDRVRQQDGRNAAATAEAQANVEAWQRLRANQTGSVRPAP
ncbi:hypothetical protein QNA08_03775 [Chelatococcus sp. SYSU_G07232]|uniref:Uncharacterized protein n=1 Tax=Chelatococcus albus TaxID=3047466 RepID=A0ABT7AD96_9HYPH|nr:hypothetical protein [Chelatococcus sp. SYSU_G07232]MDJ1157356.1 hypothetical protein [Chelatococcus sp. SYSU_G07232]